MNDLYSMIFKRKTFKTFDENLKITKRELNNIENYIKNIKPFFENANISYKIVKKEETTCKRGEYCILIYSEIKESLMLNIGYMYEQLDLYLASKNIGVSWYGRGKVKNDEDLKYNDLDFVIMLAIGKCEEEDFRKDYTRVKRKDLDTIWIGKFAMDVANVVRYSPSSYNSQPWRVYTENNLIKVYRDINVKSKFAGDKSLIFNIIDMGIFIYLLDITLNKKGYRYKKLFFNEKNCGSLEPIIMYVVE